MATTKFMVRILDSDLNKGIIHDSYSRNSEGITSYQLYEHLLCKFTYVSVNLSAKRFAEILYKILHRYFGDGVIESLDKEYYIIKFNGIETHVHVDEKTNNQTMTQFRKELYKVVNTIL